ncbi:MAG: bifunctional cobalt-precorrin-7 (C(5))-methyltransferase/cobalt-precorrin-6B (C(15))-methyltransferase [Blautia sp.]
MALCVPRGRVYAIEKKPEAVELLRQNRQKFRLEQLEIVEGTAPEAMEGLEAPTHAFIGGSSGNLREIVMELINKNPQVRMVINCITLETVSEVLESVNTLGLVCEDLVQVAVARSKNVGRYHMMMGENPIYIITCSKGGEV